MISLRHLILNVFLGGMCFDSFITAMFNNHLFSAFVFAVATILLMTKSIKCYDKVKVNK
jgi:hypothetical protein